MSSFAMSSCYGRKCVSTSSIPSLPVSCTGQLIHTLLVSHQCAPEAIHFHLPPHWYTPRTSSTAPGHPLPITIPGDSRGSSSIRLCSTWSAAAHVCLPATAHPAMKPTRKAQDFDLNLKWRYTNAALALEWPKMMPRRIFYCLQEAELTRGARWLNP